MKLLLRKMIILSLLAGCAFASCKKENNTTRLGQQPTPGIDTLIAPGKEYIFSHQIWKDGYDGWDRPVNHITIIVPYNFFKPDAKREVSILPDSSTTWIPIQHVLLPPRFPSPFYYWLFEGELIIENPHNDLSGNKATIKIKFL